jgi:hypothetical protein
MKSCIKETSLKTYFQEVINEIGDIDNTYLSIIFIGKLMITG